MISPLRKLEKKELLSPEIEIFLRQISEAKYKIPSEYISQSFKIQRLNTETTAIWDKTISIIIWRTEIKTILSIFLKHSIKVYWKRKSYLSWGGFDQKVLLPNWVSLETRHQNCAEHQQWRIRCLQAVRNHSSPSLQSQSISPNKKAAAYPAIIALSSESFQIQEYFVEKCFRSCSHSLRQCSCGSARLNTPWQNMRWR